MFYLVHKMIKNTNKRGSHVGMVLSFTLFITFLIFTYFIIGPPITLKNEGQTIELIKKQVFEKLLEDVIVIRAYDVDNTNGCVELTDPSYFSNPQVLAKNSNDIEIGSTISSTISVLGGEGFMKIYLTNSSFKKQTSWSGSSCASILPKNIIEEKRFTETGILNLINLVNNSYEEMKEEFDIRNEEFSIHFAYNDSYVVGEERTIIHGYEQVKTDIYARTFNINYLDIHGNEKIGGLIIKAW